MPPWPHGIFTASGSLSKQIKQACKVVFYGLYYLKNYYQKLNSDY